MAVLQTLFLSDAEEMARTAALPRRKRKLTGPAFATGTDVSFQAIGQRIAGRAVDSREQPLCQALEYACAVNADPLPLLERFRGAYAFDTTDVALPEGLAGGPHGPLELVPLRQKATTVAAGRGGVAGGGRGAGAAAAGLGPATATRRQEADAQETPRFLPVRPRPGDAPLRQRGLFPVNLNGYEGVPYKPPDSEPRPESITAPGDGTLVARGGK